MITIESFITDTNKANNPASLFSIYKSFLSNFGFDKIVYSFITDINSLGLKKQHAIENNYPEDWLKYYMKNNLMELDPVPKKGLSSNSLFLWDDIKLDNIKEKKQIQIMNEAKEAKLLNGVGIPLHSLNEVAGVGIASSVGGAFIDKDSLATIRCATMQFHWSYSELIRKNSIHKAFSLTKREKEILHWYAEGKSDYDIATILSISVDTIRFHSKNIYSKLEVNQRLFAVVKALKYGIISPNSINL